MSWSEWREEKKKTTQEIKTMGIARKGTKLPLLTDDTVIHGIPQEYIEKLF